MKLERTGKSKKDKTGTTDIYEQMVLQASKVNESNILQQVLLQHA